MKIKLAVMFGGLSPEHDISVITAIQAINAADKSRYEVIPVYFDKFGCAYADKRLKDVKSVKEFKPSKVKRLKFVPNDGIYTVLGKLIVDCALLCFHGDVYEGGGIAALLELVGIPYVGSGITPSAVGMDKNLQKIVAKSVGVKVIDYSVTESASKITLPLGEEFVVKPNSCGSSIGVTSCKTEEEVLNAVSLALRFDRFALIERKAEDFYELNISAMRYRNKILLSDIEKPVKKGELLTFNDKYIDKSGKLKGMKNLSREFPANITDNLKKEISLSAKNLYAALNLDGAVRFDYIVENEIAYFNEVNTTPGSLSYYLWKYRKIGFSELIDMLVEEGICKAQNKKELIKNINTGVL